MLSYPSPDWPGFLRSILGQSLFTKRGIFQLPFSHLIFSAQRGHFRSNNSKGVNFLGGGGALTSQKTNLGFSFLKLNLMLKILKKSTVHNIFFKKLLALIVKKASLKSFDLI